MKAILKKCIQNLFPLVLGITFIIAFSYYHITDHLDKTRLDRYYKADVAGETINCKEFVEARQFGERNSFFPENTASVGLLSYIHANNIEFSQCHAEIDALKQEYCSSKDISNRQVALDLAMSRYSSARKYRNICSSVLEHRLSLINDTVEITDSKVVHLHQAQVTIAAKSIHKLSYKEIANRLWQLQIHVSPYENTETDIYNVYFSSEATLSAARQKLALLM